MSGSLFTLAMARLVLKMHLGGAVTDTGVSVLTKQQ